MLRQALTLSKYKTCILLNTFFFLFSNRKFWIMDIAKVEETSFVLPSARELLRNSGDDEDKMVIDEPNEVNQGENKSKKTEKNWY